MNTQNFLDALDKLTFVKYGDKTLHTAEGFEISYEIELNGGAISKYPLQFIFRIRKDNTHVQSWGCSDNDDNIIANIWWQKKESAMHQLEYDAKDKKKAELSREFEALTILKLSL
jgi:hypothetical protein